MYMYSTWAFYLSKPPCSIRIRHCNKIGIKSMHGDRQWLYCKTNKLQNTSSSLFLLRMLVNTVKKKESEVSLHFPPHCGQPNHTACTTKVHCMCKQCAYHYVQHLGIPFEQAAMLIAMYGGSQWLYYKTKTYCIFFYLGCR